MEKTVSIPDRLAGMVIAVALLVVGVGFMVLGVTFLPVIGIFVGIPVLGLAWHFLTPKAFVIERIAGFLVPNNLMYHRGHAWARVEANDIITVGMDDFAVKLLGSVDSISLPEKGAKVKQGSPGWLIEADSRAIRMLSPVEGEVVAINREVVNSPALAFGDPYGKGWLLKVTNSNPAANLANMVPTAMIGKWLEEIRETFSCLLRGQAAAGLHQDGGEPVSGLARAVDPQRWDDVAREFLLTK
jgi:glycine cleavage system H lipoate-binding protein